MALLSLPLWGRTVSHTFPLLPRPVMARKTAKPTADGKELVLCAMSGDIDAGTIVPLPIDEPLQIGRSSKGLKLLDTLVSIQHARIEYDPKRGYVVFDLGSATGTWVDEECLKNESRPIGIGSRLRFGDTVFEVQAPTIAPWWFKYFAGAVALSAIGASLLFLAQGLGTPAPPALRWNDNGGVLVGGTRLTSIPVPPEFLRSRGLSVGQLSIRDVKNYDFDGVEEMWVRTGDDRESLVTFAPDGTWIELGDLPADCTPFDAAQDGFPTLRCNGTTWMFRNGRYRVEAQEGVVVWFRKTGVVNVEPEPEHPKGGKGAKGKAPPPQPVDAPPPVVTLAGAQSFEDQPLEVGRFATRSGQHLGLFLSARGVNGPIHYLICEGAFPGIKAQVLRADGVVQTLSKGCINELKLTGTSHPGAQPYAFALTPEGRDALIADVRTFYGGNPDGLFLPPDRAELLDSLEVDPGLLIGATKLFGDTKEDPTTQSFEPLPDNNPNRPPLVVHLLEATDRRILAAPAAFTATITRPGVVELTPSQYLDTADACLKLRMRTRDFTSHGIWSLISRTFLTIEEVGCGEPKQLLSVDYFPTQRDVRVGNLDLRVVIEGGPTPRGLEVQRARVSYREHQD